MVADKAQKQLEDVCKKDHFIESLQDFNKTKERMDNLCIEKLIGKDKDKEE